MASTINDVARSAGVSTTTVSRVLNGASNVSGETRTKVLSAISELRYCPNPHAAELGRVKSVASSNDHVHVRALVGEKGKTTIRSEANLQGDHRWKVQLHSLERKFVRVRRVIAKLTKDLENLKSITG